MYFFLMLYSDNTSSVSRVSSRGWRHKKNILILLMPANECDCLSTLVVVSESILAYSDIYIASRRSPEIFLGRPMRAGWFTPRERGRSNVQRDSAGGFKDGWSNRVNTPQNASTKWYTKYLKRCLSRGPIIGSMSRRWRGKSFFPVAVMRSISIREIGKLSHTPKCLLACRWLRDNPSPHERPELS